MSQWEQTTCVRTMPPYVCKRRIPVSNSRSPFATFSVVLGTHKNYCLSQLNKLQIGQFLQRENLKWLGQ